MLFAEAPAHVPADRIVDFDIFNPPGVEQDYFAAWEALATPDGPGIVWTRANGGHWIATRGALVRDLWADNRRLSSEVLAVTPGLGDVMRFIPLQQDPPEHQSYRNAVMKGFASRHIVAMEPKVRAVARELIAGLAPRGGCEFMADFAEILPLHIFLTLIDVPLEDRPRLRALGAQLTRPDGTMTVEQLRDAADDYLAPYIAQRMAHPGDDLFSRILAEPVAGRPWTLDEARRMCRNLLFGGLDTVVAAVGMAALHLARHADDQAALRADPALIPDAADELMRRYPTVSVSRNVVEDMAVDGVALKRGDIVYLPGILHNLDAASFDAPHEVRFDRRLNAARHTTMGAGAHRCVGAGLARMEMIVFLEEWLADIPPFRLDAAAPVRMKGGNVGACTHLPLRWD
ncbi:cytochrome P450 [Sphingobium amiense]|uniref:Cytochrome P450 n=1 Tax=Sphingobium amiense TaxID=135719 RepID=A0A494W1F2_9SPHN|nr:cytochrome P450 [Sphingobium amiense]BBD98483.1 cytochrome P450 [Sphingobium amiense]